MKDLDKPSSRYAILVLWLAVSWVVMTLTHELGHVIAGLLSGAQLVQLELRPWRLPYSVFQDDDHALITLWAGPVVGCALPLVCAVAARRPIFWFVAWFCLLANSVYLLLGWWTGDGELDSARMIRAGTHPAALLGVVAIALPLGYVQFRRAIARVMTEDTLPARAQLKLAFGLSGWLIVQTLIGIGASRGL